MMGCTKIPLALDARPDGIERANPSAVLAEALARHAHAENQRPQSAGLLTMR
jgi:hypothetical protein